MKAFHERTGSIHRHIGLKVKDASYYDQARCPVYSDDIPRFEVFWDWAENNLPIYEHQEPFKAAY